MCPNDEGCRSAKQKAKQVPDYDDEEFPILCRVGQGFKLHHEEIDALNEEVKKHLETSRLPSSEDKNEERTKLLMLALDILLEELLSCALDGDKRDKALCKLVYSSIVTPSNLESFLRVLDENVRTGMIQCCAVKILYNIFLIVRRSWSMKLPCGSYCSSVLIVKLCKELEEFCSKGKKYAHVEPKGSEFKCYCRDLLPGYCIEKYWQLLYMAISCSKEKPAKILGLVDSFNLPRIFQPNVDAATNNQIKTFRTLHDICICMLKKEDSNAIRAKAFLRKLGGCHDLFRRVLRLTITGEQPLFSTTGATHKEIAVVLDFTFTFLHCLVPPPRDGATSSLVRRAHRSLQKSTNGIKSLRREENIEGIADKHLLHLEPGFWKGYCRSKPSDEKLWEMVHDRYLTSDADPKNIRREWRQSCRDHFSGVFGELGQDEMCANCFVMERERGEKQLFECKNCKLITYCCRKCQVEHWKKSHKMYCCK